MIFGRIMILSLASISFAYGQLQFSEIALEAGIDHHYLSVNDMGGGAAFFDMDNDGDIDLWISGGLNRDVLYENDGLGNFKDISVRAGLGITKNFVTSGVITGDINNDGYIDVLLLTHRGFTNYLLKNNGDNTFKNITIFSGIDQQKAYCLAAAFGDVNLDGRLDLYVANYIEKDKFFRDEDEQVIGFDHDCYENYLYLNNGDETFTEAGHAWGVKNAGCTLATMFSDIDGDHDPDLLLANDFGAWIQPNALFENQYPISEFVDISTSSNMNIGIYGMGIAAGDIDNDQDLDYYITNIGRNALMVNQGSNIFEDLTLSAGVEDILAEDSSFTVGWGTGFLDLDNDKDLDLFVANGYVPAAAFIDNSTTNPNRLFENLGTGTFKSVEMDSNLMSPQRGRGFIYGDIDSDGDLDFLVCNVNRQATSDTIQRIQLFRNETISAGNWVMITLRGSQSNYFGIGSKIIVYVKGEQYLKELNGGYGTHASQHAADLHFGMGNHTTIDSIEVYWPGGNREIFFDLEVNQPYTFSEKIMVRTEEFTEDNDIKLYPNPFRHQLNVEFNSSQNWDSYEIIDVHGRHILYPQSIKSNGSNFRTIWKAPYPGVYLLRIQGKHHTIVKKITAN